MAKLAGTGQKVAVATAEHADAISGIYRSVLIDPQILLDLVSPCARISSAARQSVKAHGGFLSPPDEMDMEMALRHGLVMVYLQDGEVLGFNRYATDPETVWQVLCSEFQLDPSRDYSESGNFKDWNGSRKLNDYKTLTSVRWLDRQQVFLVLRAAQAGLQNEPVGRLAWAIDSAVHPEHRHSGIGRTLVKSMRQAVSPGVACLAYRMFEILKINGIDVVIDNDPSRRAFVDASSKLFACTEEDITISDSINIKVRWNHWIKYYQS